MTNISINNKRLDVFTSLYIEENMYIILKEDKALVIDPNDSEEVLPFLQQNAIKEVTILLTHEHPDHTCGIPKLQKCFKTKLICQKECAQQIADKRNNRPILVAFVLAIQDEKNGTNYEQEVIKDFDEYECHADIVFEKDFSYNWQGEHFVLRHTPGHSLGSCCIVWNKQVVFTGDSLLKNIPVITRFPGGSTEQYKQITKPYLDMLSDDIFVFPGHGESFIMKELRKKAV